MKLDFSLLFFEGIVFSGPELGERKRGKKVQVQSPDAMAKRGESWPQKKKKEKKEEEEEKEKAPEEEEKKNENLGSAGFGSGFDDFIFLFLECSKDLLQ